MILYDPVQGDVLTKHIKFRPQTCFIMTQLGTPIPNEIKNIRRTLEKYLKQKKLKTIDASSDIKGKDFLLKIWEMILSVPVGIAIISKELTPYTLANIFYEIGLLQAYGKETLIIKTKDSYVPSDFVRTEYIEYDRNFKKKINRFLHGLKEQSEYYANASILLEGNPLLSIDYLRRAFLISGNEKYKRDAQIISQANPLDKQTKFGIDSFLKV
ncbi:MAG: hypothetical protein NUV86_00005 [Candidatus Scalindua sp.]|nr:hypothetical protein [Candidatus Scalindua sp.]